MTKHELDNKLEKLTTELSLKKKTSNRFSILRLLIFIGGFIAVYFGVNFPVGIFILVISLIIIAFIIVVKFHSKISLKIQELNNLISLYENEKKEENEIFYNGQKYTNNTHPYSSDLDLFGPNSLFSEINRTVTLSGMNLLASYLQKASDNRFINARHEAIKELKNKPELIEKVLLLHFLSPPQSENKIPGISKEELNTYYTTNTFLNIFRFAYPLLLLIFSGLIFFNPIMIYALIALYASKLFIDNKNQIRQQKVFALLEKKNTKFKKYKRFIDILENEMFSSTQMINYKNNLFSENKNLKTIFKNMVSLSAKINRANNMLIRVLADTLFAWNFHLSYKAEQQLLTHREFINKQIKVIAEIDVLISSSLFAIKNPQYSFPKVIEDKHYLSAIEIGHPLIKNNCVLNNYKITKPASVHIVTGSNMAGKSTFLRTIGINIVMANAGLPVFAKEFVVGIKEIFSFMKISDSLYKQESYFYAELQRIKQILQFIKKHKDTLILIDEPLKGTNSADKQKGSKAIVKQIISSGSFGLVATHDLALSNLEKELPDSIKNYYFDISVKNKQLEFDYKLNPGVCKTFNANILMEQMGIDINNE